MHITQGILVGDDPVPASFGRDADLDEVQGRPTGFQDSPIEGYIVVGDFFGHELVRLQSNDLLVAVTKRLDGRGADGHQSAFGILDEVNDPGNVIKRLQQLPRFDRATEKVLSAIAAANLQSLA